MIYQTICLWVLALSTVSLADPLSLSSNEIKSLVKGLTNKKVGVKKVEQNTKSLRTHSTATKLMGANPADGNTLSMSSEAIMEALSKLKPGAQPIKQDTQNIVNPNYVAPFGLSSSDIKTLVSDVADAKVSAKVSTKAMQQGSGDSTQPGNCPDISMWDPSSQSCQCPPNYWFISNSFCFMPYFGGMQSGQSLPAYPHGAVFSDNAVLLYYTYGVVVLQTGCDNNCASYFQPYMVNATALGVEAGELLVNSNGAIQLISTSGEVYQSWDFTAGTYFTLSNYGAVTVYDASGQVQAQSGKYVACPPGAMLTADNQCACPDISQWDPTSESCQCPPNFWFINGNTLCFLPYFGWLPSGDALPAYPHGMLFAEYALMGLINEGVAVVQHNTGCGDMCPFYFEPYRVNATALGVMPGKLLMNENGAIQLISTSDEVYQEWDFSAGTSLTLSSYGNVVLYDASGNVESQSGKYVACPPGVILTADNQCVCQGTGVWDQFTESCQCPPGSVYMDNTCLVPFFGGMKSGEALPAFPGGLVFSEYALMGLINEGVAVVQNTDCGDNCPAYFQPYMVNATALGVMPGKLLMNTNGAIQLISTTGEVYQEWDFAAGTYFTLTKYGNVIIYDASGNVEYQSGKYVACPPGAMLTDDLQCVCPAGSKFYHKSETCQCTPGLEYGQDGTDDGSFGCSLWPIMN